MGDKNGCTLGKIIDDEGKKIDDETFHGFYFKAFGEDPDCFIIIHSYRQIVYIYK